MISLIKKNGTNPQTKQVIYFPQWTRIATMEKTQLAERMARSQTAHMYNALKRGYIIMEDCSEQGGERYNIYYDGQTERAPIFERNLINDGFSVREYQTA